MYLQCADADRMRRSAVLRTRAQEKTKVVIVIGEIECDVKLRDNARTNRSA